MKVIQQSRHFYQLIKTCVHPLFAYLQQGCRSKQLKLHCTHFAKHLFRHLRAFGDSLNQDYRDLGDLQGPRMQKLRTLTAGLHALLPHNPLFSYSILIPFVEQPHPDNFRKTLLSALQQTAPQLDVILAYTSQQLSKEIGAIIEHCQKAFPDRLRIFAYDTFARHELLNLAAFQAKGHFLLVLEAEDWIRPDFLFRSEQLLRLLKEHKQACLYTDEYEINESDHPIPGRRVQKPHRLIFPYVFHNALGKSLLIPRHLWELTGGMHAAEEEKEMWDLALRLDQAGAHFHSLPFYLYAKRPASHPSSSKAVKPFLEQLQAYARSKQLQWEWMPGLTPHTYRAVPALPKRPTVQAIIPFKDQKDLTLKTIKSLLAQIDVEVVITAVDHASQDDSIGKWIQEMGGEVLDVKEPFNYSRLNNLAVNGSRSACPYLLFINNDVELEEGALLEMCRWASQAPVGIVGCLLRYPNGLLQHGGIDLKREGPGHQMIWNHSEKFACQSKQKLANQLRLCDAVTAACAMMRRQVFLDVGGFDEIWYPIAYSDTNLAVKVQAQGLHCLYTPYACGIHHESVSRKYENIEDVEMSSWLHKKYLEGMNLSK